MDIEKFMPRNWMGLIGLIVAFAFLGAAVTYAVVERDDRPPAETSADVGFLRDMSAHHEQALALATSELQNGTAPEAQLFAREILQQQSWELGAMHRQLQLWGRQRDGSTDEAMAWMDMPTPVEAMPGMASEAELAALRQADGADADALFIALMQDHHRGGVAMATAAADRVSDPWVKALAERMARNQVLEIREMDSARRRAELTDEPAGYEPGPFPAQMGDMEGMEHGGSG